MQRIKCAVFTVVESDGVKRSRRLSIVLNLIQTRTFDSLEEMF